MAAENVNEKFVVNYVCARDVCCRLYRLVGSALTEMRCTMNLRSAEFLQCNHNRLPDLLHLKAAMHTAIKYGPAAHANETTVKTAFKSILWTKKKILSEFVAARDKYMPGIWCTWTSHTTTFDIAQSGCKFIRFLNSVANHTQWTLDSFHNDNKMKENKFSLRRAKPKRLRFCCCDFC